MSLKHKAAIPVAELFAGVGGFRLGLEGYRGRSATTNYKKKRLSRFKVIWSNQFEPSATKQHASHVYVERFGAEGHHNSDVNTIAGNAIPPHKLLVGGFPCQDFSIANPRNRKLGLKGRKGILWWQIHRILEARLIAGKPTRYLLLENVDRLLTSRNGRDFHTILSSLARLGYDVEWRVVNAAEYGFPQRRRRVFMIAYHSCSSIVSSIIPEPWIIKDGVLAKALPVSTDVGFTSFHLNDVLFNSKARIFENAGISQRGLVTTGKVAAKYDGPKQTIASVLQSNSDVPLKFYISPSRLSTWRKYKAAQKATRQKPDGSTYLYKEGVMPFPDPKDKPSRTIITSEGGSSPSRTTHVISTSKKRFRRLTPVELERLNQFPDDFTSMVSDVKRGFLMGNALVIGVVERIGSELGKRISD